jgi:hypothetical protein
MRALVADSSRGLGLALCAALAVTGELIAGATGLPPVPVAS